LIGDGRTNPILIPRLRIEMRSTRFGGMREDAGVADEAAENRIRHAGHGRQHRGWSHNDSSDGERCRHTRTGGHGMLDRIVPVLLHATSEPLAIRKAPAAAEALSLEPLRFTSRPAPLWRTCGGSARRAPRYQPAFVCR